MKKKKILLGLSIVAAAFVVSACGKKAESNNNNQNDSQKDPDDKPTDNESQVYTVTWKNGDSNHKIDELNEGSQITAPTQNPTKDSTAQYDYTFDGWYTEATGGTKVTDFGTATADVTYYARFTETVRQYTYTFFDEDGVTELKKETVNYGTQITAPTGMTKPETESNFYVFDGWYTEKTGGTKVTDFSTVTGAVSYYARYTTKNKYTYSFIVGDGAIKTDTIKEGESIVAPTDPVKPLTPEYTYTFDGWYTQAEGGEKVTEFGAISETVTYYAHFKETKNQYKYKFVDDKLNVLVEKTVDYGTAYEVPEAPVKENTQEYSYEFDGWYTAQTGGAKIENFTYVTREIIFYAQYKETRNKYTYTFYDENGEELSASTVDYGTNITAPENPTKDATAEYTYTFDGWYTEATGGTKVTDFGKITDNVSFYARFTATKNQYTYTFYDEAGEVISTSKVDYGTQVTVPATPIKDSTEQYSYTFAGWYDENDQLVDVTEGITEDKNLYAKFTENVRQYTYTFYNYDQTAFKTVTANYGSSIDAPTAIPTKDLNDGNNYVFDGWYTQAEGGEKVTEYGNLTADVSYYAQFIIEAEQVTRYTYTFYDADGSVLKTDYIAEGELIVAPSTSPKKEGNQEFSYTFDGWYTAQQGGEKVVDFGNISSDISFYARYIEAKNQYTYTFYDENGSVISTNTVDYGTQIIVPEDPTKEATQAHSYNFIGWYDEDDELIEQFGLLTENVSFYAKFEEVTNQYTYRFYDEDDTIIKEKTINYGGAILSPGEDPVKAEDADYTYKFDGWYTAKVGGTKVTDFGAVVGDINFYAHYTAIAKLVVSFEVNQGDQVFQNLKVVSGASIQLPTPAEIEGFEFDGWYLDNQYTTKYNNQAITEDTVIYGNYVQLFTVTLVAENQTIDTITVKNNSKVVISNNPSKDGYYFAYWALNNQEFDLNTPITSNITLVAVFEEALEEENVGFGGTYTAWADLFASTGSTRTDDKGRTKLGATSDTDSVSMNGFTFEGKAVLESGILNTQSTSITIQILNNNASINMSATWASGDAGVIKVYKDGSLYHTSSSTYSNKTALTLDLTGLSEGTYTIKAEKTGSATGQASLQVSTIYYSRIVEYVTVSYVTNSDQVIEATRVKKGDSLGELPTVNNRSGYRGEGWYTTEDFVVGTEASASASITANTTLYYKWIELTEDDLATITFNVNVDGKTIDSLQIEKGTKLAALPELNIEGYRLDGWYTDSNFHTAFNINTYTFTTDTTLYAQYIRVYNVTFLDKDGKEIKTVTVDANTKVTESIAKPYIEGYKFDHWVINGTNTEFDLATEYIGDDYTLKAVYVVDTNPVTKVSITSYEGNEESATVKFAVYKNSSNDTADEYNIYLNGTVFNNVKLTDDNLYVTTSGSTVTAELFGLKAGSYNVTVVPVFDGVELEAAQASATFAVTAYDRSGYAHFNNNNEGVGAYNDDGTIKDNAIVLYVTDANKNTVTLSYKGKTVSGIGNILNSVGQACGDAGHETECKKVSNGKTYYGKGNTNQGILLDLAQDNIPLIVRFIGCVSNSGLYQQGTYNANSTGLIEGLTGYDSVDCGGSEGDNGHMARMKSAKNITFEGVGNDAVIDGWGFHLICETAYPDLAKNFEVRNLTFMNTPEDAIGMEGQETESTLTITAAVEHCWVHHNTFLAPSISSPAESDKSEGDGSCDFKRGRYFTCSYNYFENCHKTNLVGSSKTSVQYCLTYHHNLWYNCAARQPLARKSNIHFYNNFIIGTTDTVASLRADAYMFAENNYYLGCSRPVEYKAEGTTGVCKAIGNNVIGCYNAYDATEVTDREQTVSANCKDNATNIDYSTFDTDPTKFYYDSSKKQSDCLLTDANQARIDCVQQAGSRYRTKANNTVYKTSTNITSTASSATISGATSLTIAKGKGVLKVFTVTSAVSCTMAATSAAGFDTGYLLKMDGTVELELSTANQTAVLLPGEYVIASSVSFSGNNGKNDKETTITTCTFAPYDSEELNQQLIDQYNAAHDALPATINYTDEHYNLIKSAMDAYKNLGDLQSRISNYSDVTSAYNTYKTKGEAYVEGLISEIVLPVTASNSSLVISAKSAYSTLISKVSDASVSNYATLVEAESQMTELGVDIFLNAANQIPAEITYTSACNELISNAEAAYESLDSEQRNQSAVKTAYAKVTAARETYDSLAVIANVESAMSSANTIAQFDAAYAAYNALTTAQKAKVDSDIKSNFMVDYALTAINEIPATVTRADGGTISKARSIYDLLTDAEKNSVINYDKLTAAEATYAEFGVETIDNYQTSNFSTWTITGTTTSTTSGLAGELSTDNTITAVSDFMLNGLTSISATVSVTDKGTTTFTFYTSTDGENWTQVTALKASSNGNSTLTATANITGAVYVKITMTCTKGPGNPKATALSSVSFNK